MPQECKEDQEIFIREMQFVLYLLWKLKDVVKELMDENKKKQILAIYFVDKLGVFMTNSFINQNIVAQFLASNFEFRYPFCTRKELAKTMLSHIFTCQKYAVFLRIFCIERLLLISGIRKAKEVFITEYFSYANSSKTFLNELNPITFIGI